MSGNKITTKFNRGPESSNALEAKLTILQRENIELLAKVHQLSESVEHAAGLSVVDSIAVHSHQQKVGLASAKQDLPDLSTELKDARAATEKITKDLRNVWARKESLQKEHEYLLLQLQQVQEELERASADRIRLQAAQEQTALLLAELGKRYPDTVAWTGSQFHCSALNVCRAVISGAYLAGHRFDELSIHAELTEDLGAELTVAGISNQCPSIRVTATGDVVDAFGTPVLMGHRERAALRVVPVALQYLIEAHQLSSRLGWSTALSDVFSLLSRPRDEWIFDELRIKNIQVNPDYEHIWFELSKAQFGHRQWDSFEFRIGAANVRREGFSQYPKLEFPEQKIGQRQFENWFVESEDDFGAKYELRFDLRRKTLDFASWSELNKGDQRSLAKLLLELPDWILQRYPHHPHARRPVQDWVELVRGVIEILASQDQATGGQAFA